MDTESAAERQQNEILALESIYESDFYKVPPSTVWKGAPSLPEFTIRVRHPDPEYASKVFLTLNVK